MANHSSLSVSNTTTQLYVYTLLFPLFLLLCFSSTTTGETSFHFQTLATPTNLKLLGDAHIYNNTTVRLTGDLTVPNSGAGRVLYNKPITFRRPGNPNPTSFATHFSFSILDLNPNSVGGGFAFVISPDDISIGSAGGYLGIPTGAVSIEFDTAKDAEFKDINGNHVGLDINSVVSLHVADLDSVNVSLRSGELIHSWVDYSGSNHQLKVFVSYSKTKPISPVLSVNMDLSQYVNESMYVGFSGSTQGSTEVHSVSFWSFTSTFDDPNRQLGPNSPQPSSPLAPISNFMSGPFNPMPYLMPPTLSTTQTTPKYHNLNKLIKGLIGALVGILLTTGGITIYLKFQNGHPNHQYYNICNCCSNVNNGNV